MWDSIKEGWPILVTLFLGVFGFGKMMQENINTKKRVLKLEEQEEGREELLTLAHCREKQGACHTIQKIYHGGLEKDFASLQKTMEKDVVALQKALAKIDACNKAQHKDIMDRSNAQHSDIMNHLLALNGNGKT